MNLFVCADDDMGLAFNNRRQSRDRELIRYMLEESHNKLYIAEYSRSLFQSPEEGSGAGVKVIEDPGSLPKDAYYFLELRDPAELAAHIDKLYLCRWNRKYPSDVKCSLNLPEFRLISSTDITGSSHDKITIEVYRR